MIIHANKITQTYPQLPFKNEVICHNLTSVHEIIETKLWVDI